MPRDDQDNADDADGAMIPLRAAADALRLDPFELWLEYFALGGNADAKRVADWLGDGDVPLRIDYELLAVVVNEALADRGLDPDVPWTL